MVYSQRGNAYLAKGDHDKAIADYDQAIKLAPGVGQLHHDRGYTYQLKGEYKKAIADFDKSIEYFPQNAQAYNNRAWSLLQDRRSEARDCRTLEKAVELNRNSAASWDTLGTIYEALGQRDKAIEAYQTAMKADPKQQTSREHLVRLGVIGQ